MYIVLIETSIGKCALSIHDTKKAAIEAGRKLSRTKYGKYFWVTKV